MVATTQQDEQSKGARQRGRLPLDDAQPKVCETATFALGCFWQPDAQFGALDGVVRTRVGYTGGRTKSPSYESLGDHIEAVQIDFDPKKISYERLLEVFWESHRPEFKAFSRQYMAAIFTHDATQYDFAMESLAAQRRKRRFKLFARKIYTEILPAETFWLAEGYHQKYRLRQQPPLMREFERVFGTDDDFVYSTTAARINAVCAGHAEVIDDVTTLGLSRDAQAYLKRLIRGDV